MKLTPLNLSCPQCGRAFVRQAGLSKHLRTCPAGAVPRAVFAAKRCTILLDSVPLTANHAYKQTTMRSKNGKAFAGRRLTDDAEAWRTRATLTIRTEAARQGFTIARTTPLIVACTFGLPQLYTRDLDNFTKLLMDALAQALGWDDRYCVELILRKRRHDPAHTLIECLTMEATE